MKYLPVLLLIFLPLLSIAQSETADPLHEGQIVEGKYIGPQRWYNEEGRKTAEVIYDESGNLISFRTWTMDGELMDDEVLSTARRKKELPELDFVFEDDGFGLMIMPPSKATTSPCRSRVTRSTSATKATCRTGPS
jgi:hypothetical protein